MVLGAAVGAPLRFLVDRAVSASLDPVFPWGTFAVNVVGSLLLGLVLGLGAPGPVLALVGTGFCGALTTYSTFSWETLRLVRDGAGLYGLANVCGSVLAALAAAQCGLLAGRALS